ARRLGLEQPGFAMTEREHIDLMLQRSGWGPLADLEEKRWIDCQSDFETAHFLNGFGHADGKYHFRVDWASVDNENYGLVGPHADMPTLPDHWGSIEAADEAHPFRLATSPARQFLNSTFNETPSSIGREGRPELMIHPDDAAGLGIAAEDLVTVGNRRGEVKVHARLFEGLKRGVVISEGLWPNSAFVDGKGINTLTGADPVAPFGGAAVHDIKVWVRAA
ncbi:MAG: molybdopterin oxidoreductase family protein, partial [Rhizobiales bacterium]|nr:molybdopterin oxidoreductase family protein [Hyphomicrobiales bacterium]